MSSIHSGTAGQILRFGPFEADLASGQLRKRGVKVPLREQSFEVLATLLTHPGQVVTRDDLRRQLWHDDVHVDFEKSLNTVVGRLRAVLGDPADHPHFIETMPKRGYRFLATVSESPVATAKAPTTRSRLVVLPFVNLSGDPGQEYFSDAMTDDIITVLATLASEQLAVIARTTAMHYKGSRKDVAHIGRELSVDYAVEGGVLRYNDRLCLNVQLVQTQDQAHLFARKYDVSMDELFGLHQAVAADIGNVIPGVGDRIRRRDERTYRGFTRKPTESRAAYDDYIRGRLELWKMTPPSMSRAKQYFEAALAHDPNFALAYCGLARLFWYSGFWGFAPSRETDAVGRFYALRAIEIDSSFAESHALLSYYPKQRFYNEPLVYYDWQSSLRDVVHARELNPTSPLVQERYAIVLMVLGRNEEAVAELERGLESDPLSLDLCAWLIIILSIARQNERAIEQAFRLVEMEPEHWLAHFAIGFAYLAMKRYEDSAVAHHKAVELSGELPFTMGWLGLALGLAGKSAEAREVIERLRAIAAHRYVPPTSFAWTFLGLDEIDEAFTWLERAVDAPDRMMSPIKTYPFFDPLRRDPRFSALLRKMNLEP